jgi:DNA polymerase-3 subunit epsilon
VKELDWRRFGLEGKALGHLVASAGHFLARGHRAGEDCWALTCLLARQASDGRTIAAHLLDTARRPSYRVVAWGAPFSTRDTLKAAGYRWNATQRVWWIEGDGEKIGHEDAFLRSLHGGTSRFVIWTAAVGTNGQQKPERCRKVY